MNTGTQGYVDDLLLYQELLSSATGANVIRNRRKAKRNFERAYGFVWGFRNWPSKTGFASGMTTSDFGDGHAVVGMPGDFSSFGRSGALYPENDPSRPRALRPMTLHTYVRAWARDHSVGDPTHYSQGYPVGSAGGVVVYRPNFTIVFSALYDRAMPTLVDNGDPEEHAGEPDMVDVLPKEWVDTVVYEYAVLYQMKDAGKVQAAALQERTCQANLKNMMRAFKANREMSHQIIPFGAGGWGSGMGGGWGGGLP